MRFDSSQILILGLAILGLLVVMRVTRRRLGAAQTSERKSVRERYQELASPQAVVRDMEEVMAELDQLSRQIHGRLDTKLARLEAVIRDADERIDRLARLVRSADGGSTLDVTVADSEPGESVPSSRPAESILEERTAASRRLQPNRARILQMADRGMSPLQIAEATGRTTGEIELILSLRKAEEAAGAARGS
jgi:hypothetical protein